MKWMDSSFYRRLRRCILGVALCAIALDSWPQAMSSAAGSHSELIPRTALFGNPVRTQARLSPDGRYLSFLAPRDGVMNVWLAQPGALPAAKPITNDRKRGIRQHFWAQDARHVLFLQDEGGDENWRVYSVDVETGA